MLTPRARVFPGPLRAFETQSPQLSPNSCKRAGSKISAVADTAARGAPGEGLKVRARAANVIPMPKHPKKLHMVVDADLAARLEALRARGAVGTAKVSISSLLGVLVREGLSVEEARAAQPLAIAPMMKVVA